MTDGELAAVLESHGMRVRRRYGSRGWQAQCPAHDDGRHLSLSVANGRDGRRLMYCHAGCEFEDVRLALRLPRDAFWGWDAFRKSKIARTSPPRLTLIISCVQVLDVRGLQKAYEHGRLEPSEGLIRTPPRARGATSAVAEDMSLLFGLADAAGVPDVPLMYGTHWAAERLGIDSYATVSRALWALRNDGQIVHVGGVRSTTGRRTRTYRRAA